jgi:hypothetical protein
MHRPRDKLHLQNMHGHTGHTRAGYTKHTYACLPTSHLVDSMPRRDCDERVVCWRENSGQRVMWRRKVSVVGKGGATLNGGKYGRNGMEERRNAS